jgi:flagellar basal-body rod protein FlgG
LPTAPQATRAPGAFHPDADGRLLTAERHAAPARDHHSFERDVSQHLEAGRRVGEHRRTDRHPAAWHDRARTFQNSAGCSRRQPLGATTASGDPTTGVPGTDGIGTTTQGFLEESNVSVVEEMVNMILGQRAYEANSRVVKAADEMLGQVNNMAR